MTSKPKKESPSKKKQTPTATIRMEARKQSAYGWKHQKQKEKKTS